MNDLESKLAELLRKAVVAKIAEWEAKNEIEEALGCERDDLTDIIEGIAACTSTDPTSVEITQEMVQRYFFGAS